MAFSKQKDRILLALSAGVKLHEFMRERDAPSKAMLEEWRDNDPEFEQAYLRAEEEGRVKRGEPAPPKPKAPATVIDQDGGERLIPRSTALMRESAPSPLAPLLSSEREEDEPDPRVFRDEPPAPSAAPAESPDAVFRHKMLARRQAGESSGELLRTPGMSHTKLARWRAQDPAFKAAWDACRTTPASAAARVAKPTKAAPSAGLATEIAGEFEQLRGQVRQLEQENARLIAETHRWSEAEKKDKERHQGELDALARQVADYQEYQREQQRLTRELDVALFGEQAVPQASLCDLIEPARKLSATLASVLTKAQEHDERDSLYADATKHLQFGEISVADYVLLRQLPDVAGAREHLVRRVIQLGLQKADAAAQLALAAQADTTPQHPGLLLAELLRQAGTPRAPLAAALGIGLSTLNSLLAGNTSLNLAVCAKLEKIYWGTAEAWCRRQVDYDNHRPATPHSHAA